MKRQKFLAFLTATLLGAGHLGAQPTETTDRAMPSALDARLKQFFADKKAQARTLAEQENQEQAPEVWQFFDAGEKGDWQRVASIYRTLRRGAYQYEGGRKDARLATMVWQPVNECYGAWEQCAQGEEKYVTRYAREILDSIPRGSIYFGGTDPGRWLPTAFSQSHAKGEPCFVLTQNALADGLYLKYLRAMYGGKIKVPAEQDSQNAFQEYLQDAQQRLEKGQLKPGENVTKVDNRVQVSGQVAVMQINGLLVRAIVEANTNRQFFIEESFPLDWMYPHLSPHGLILRIERAPQPTLSAEVLRKDRDYWTRLTDEVLGQWLRPETPVDEVCDFAARIFETKDRATFQGDVRFVDNDYACKMYSKLRSAIGGVYAWRAQNVGSAEEKTRLKKEADFAFRQAFALCPSSPEAVFRYVNLLIQDKRKEDALLLAETAQQIGPGNSSLANLIRELEKMK